MKKSLLTTAALTGILLAAQPAPANPTSGETRGMCYGTNSCHGTCDGKEHDCGGKGCEEMTKSECDEKGGKKFVPTATTEKTEKKG